MGRTGSDNGTSEEKTKKSGEKKPKTGRKSPDENYKYKYYALY